MIITYIHDRTLAPSARPKWIAFNEDFVKSVVKKVRLLLQKFRMSWVQALYGSTQNTLYALASFLAVMAGIYFTRELAILLREQLNKRLGRPSLVRVTSKKTRVGEVLRYTGQNLVP